MEKVRQKNTLNNERAIGDVRKNNLSGTININGVMKVAELESAFSKTFGLAVQVFIPQIRECMAANYSHR